MKDTLTSFLTCGGGGGAVEAVFTVSELIHEGFVTAHIPPGLIRNRQSKQKSQFWSSRLQSNFLTLSKYQFYRLTILGKFYKQA